MKRGNTAAAAATTGGRKATAAKVAPHESYVVVLDVGASSLKQGDLDTSKQCIDWILSRKMFTYSQDLFTLMSFGDWEKRNVVLPEHHNISIHSPEFATARVEWLKLLEDKIKGHPQCGGDYVAALFVSLEILKRHADDCAPKELLGLNVTLISTLEGLDAVSEADVAALIAGFRDVGAKLWIIGPDLSSEPRSKAQGVGFKFAKRLTSKLDDSVSLSFEDGLAQLNYFVPKSTDPRGTPFELELGPGFSIPLQMYLKNTETKVLPSFENVSIGKGGESSGSGGQLKRVRKYDAVGEGAEEALKYVDIDNMADETFVTGKRSGMPAGKLIDKEAIIKGYRYGTSVVPVGKDEEQIVGYPRGRKQLSLIQFTKRDNILPQFLLTNCRYLLPKANDDKALGALSALVGAMLEQELVAVARYAYNAVSHPRVVCLIPKMNKNGLPVFLHYNMPFNEDLRNYDFPALEQIGQVPSEYQLDLMDAYIDCMDLGGHDGAEERLRCRDVHNPRHQYQCQLLRKKAMHPEADLLSGAEREAVLETISPPKELLEGAKQVLEDMKEKFPLVRNEQSKAAAFKPKVNEQEAAAAAAAVLQQQQKQQLLQKEDDAMVGKFNADSPKPELKWED